MLCSEENYLVDFLTLRRIYNDIIHLNVFYLENKHMFLKSTPSRRERNLNKQLLTTKNKQTIARLPFIKTDGQILEVAG